MHQDSRRGLLLIGVMKLLKGAGLLILGVGVLSLLHRDAEHTIRHLAEILRVDTHARLVDHVLEKIGGISPRTMRRLGVGTLLYAGVFTTEGIGLLLAKRWAEYMTTGVTLSFLPLEVYEFCVHPTLLRGVVILINIAVVIYLVLEIRRRRASADSPGSISAAAPESGK
ncbi:MAG: DUF2127 domain-containing protein [Pseudomonadota bacterium]